RGNAGSARGAISDGSWTLTRRSGLPCPRRSPQRLSVLAGRESGPSCLISKVPVVLKNAVERCHDGISGDRLHLKRAPSLGPPFQVKIAAAEKDDARSGGGTPVEIERGIYAVPLAGQGNDHAVFLEQANRLSDR